MQPSRQRDREQGFTVNCNWMWTYVLDSSIFFSNSFMFSLNTFRFSFQQWPLLLLHLLSPLALKIHCQACQSAQPRPPCPASCRQVFFHTHPPETSLVMRQVFAIHYTRSHAIYTCALVSVLLCNYTPKTLVGGGVSMFDCLDFLFSPWLTWMGVKWWSCSSSRPSRCYRNKWIKFW